MLATKAAGALEGLNESAVSPQKPKLMPAAMHQPWNFRLVLRKPSAWAHPARAKTAVVVSEIQPGGAWLFWLSARPSSRPLARSTTQTASRASDASNQGLV